MTFAQMNQFDAQFYGVSNLMSFYECESSFTGEFNSIAILITNYRQSQCLITSVYICIVLSDGN